MKGRDDNVPRVIAGIAVQVTALGTAEQPGADNEDHAHGDLSADECAERPFGSRGAAEQAAETFEGIDEVDLEGFESGRETGQDAGDQGDAGNPYEDAPVREQRQVG